MPVTSAGILLYRRRAGELEVLPYWRSKDDGAWMIPKGLVEPGEEPEAAARREFEEELGTRLQGEVRPLAKVRQAGGKWVEAFCAEGDLDPERIVSNEFSMEWPPRSGEFQSFPEVDRAAWYSLKQAQTKILPSQAPLLEALRELAGPASARPAD